MRRWLIVALTIVLLHLAGCTYMVNRGRDLKDCFSANLGVGLGLSASARVTDCLAAPLGIYQDSYRLGIDGRARPQFVWHEEESGFLLLKDGEYKGESPGRTLIRTWTPLRWVLPMLTGTKPATSVQPTILWADRRYGGILPAQGTRTADHYWVQADLFLAVVGARLGVNPIEIVDFALGLLTVDILGDDR